MIIIYYDKKFKSSNENLVNYIELRKSFYGNEIYGVDKFDKFKYLLSLFSKTNQNFYIISSGSCVKEFFSSGYYEENKNRIIDIIIFQLKKDEYQNLKKKYSRISLLENNDFSKIIEHINKIESFAFNEKEILKHCSSFLLLDEYLKTPLDLHQKILEFFDENLKAPSFNQNIKVKISEILNVLNKIAETKSDFESAKRIIEKINNEADLIKCYTSESIIVYFLNKCLREVDNKLIEFAGLLNYALYKYYFNNPEIEIKENMTFYRKLIISIKDLYSYDLFEGKIICFPSFTSTTIDRNQYHFGPIETYNSYGKKIAREKCVLLKINYNYNPYYQCPCFNISYFSEYENEKEYIFPPFSFFKILKINMNDGTKENPVIIELELIPKNFNFEKNLKNKGNICFDDVEKCIKCIVNLDFNCKEEKDNLIINKKKKTFNTNDVKNSYQDYISKQHINKNDFYNDSGYLKKDNTININKFSSKNQNSNNNVENEKNKNNQSNKEMKADNEKLNKEKIKIKNVDSEKKKNDGAGRPTNSNNIKCSAKIDALRKLFEGSKK